MSDGYVIGLDLGLTSDKTAFINISSINYDAAWITAQPKPKQDLNFDLTPAGDVNFKLTISLIDNKINSFSISEHVKSPYFKNKIVENHVVGGFINYSNDLEWPQYVDAYTDLTKRLIKEAEEIILRVKNMEVFY